MEMEKTQKRLLKGMFMGATNNKRSVGDNASSEECEIRPGGMLVQKRDSSEINQNSVFVPMIKVRVKHGSLCREISVGSQASFGDLKKILAESTGMHPEDQKLVYKKKERDSKEYLDVAGVKNGSKIVLTEDITSRERRRLDMLKSARMEKVSNLLKQISSEVDKLDEKVTALEGKKAGEKELDGLSEILMTKLVELDGVSIQGELNLQKRSQERRIQKLVEAIDLLKLNHSKTSKAKKEEVFKEAPPEVNLLRRIGVTTNQKLPSQPSQILQANNSKNSVQMAAGLNQQLPLKQTQYSAVVTTNWEKFD